MEVVAPWRAMREMICVVVIRGELEDEGSIVIMEVEGERLWCKI